MHLENYWKYFDEFEQPMIFIFILDEDMVYAPQKNKYEMPEIIDYEYILRCSLEKDNKYYSFKEYEKYLFNLSKECAKFIKLNFSNVVNSSQFITDCRYEVEKRLGLFIFQGDDIKKVTSCNYFQCEPPDDYEPLNQQSISSIEYKSLYQPFIELQYENLRSFLVGLTNKYNLKPNKKIKKNNINFKFKELYTNRKTKKEFEQYLDDFLNDIKNYQGIVRISSKPYLQYFGLPKEDAKIIWKGKIGDLFTLNKYLKEKGILTGHNKNSLMNCVLLPDEPEFNWDDFHDSKHTTNRKQIMDIIDKFKNNLDSLMKKHSA